MNNRKQSNERQKNVIGILIAVIAIMSFFTIKIIGFMDMAAHMN